MCKNTQNCSMRYAFKIAKLNAIIVIDVRNNVNQHYFDAKSLILPQIFFENLSMSIARKKELTAMVSSFLTISYITVA